jgi:hypothetical protein
VLPTVCPKCGFHQDGDEECRRCGIVFARYRGPTQAARSPAYTKSSEFPDRAPVGVFRTCYRVFRWVTLAALVGILVLILRPSPPPQITISPDAAQRAETKVLGFVASAQQGRSETLELDESELNGWLAANLAIQQPRDATAASSEMMNGGVMSLAKRALAPEANGGAASAQEQSSVRDVKIELCEESLLAYVAFDVYGMNLSLELEGRLLVEDGHLRLEPTRGKLGSLPLFSVLLGSAVHRLIDSPENRDLRVSDSRLVVTSH